jgi:DNA invertase Pin-like site-specific DNA recombinase
MDQQVSHWARSLSTGFPVTLGNREVFFGRGIGFSSGASLVGCLVARVSRAEGQHIDVQVRRLEEAGCEKVFADEGVSGAKASRPGWDACLAYLREGDTLVSVRLDRWGRSTQHLLQVADELGKRGVGLVALDQPGITTEGPLGKLLFTILAAVSTFERDLIIDRTRDGLAAARARGNLGGRPKSYTAATAQAVLALRSAGQTLTEISAVCNISRRTASRILAEAQS